MPLSNPFHPSSGAENEALKQKLQAYEDEKEKLQEQLSAEIGLDNSKEHLCQVMQERDALLDYLEEESSRMSSMEKTIQDLRHVKEEYDVVQSTLEREKHALAELEMELQRRDQLLIHANQTNEDRNVECEKWNKLYQNLMKETESRNEQISRELINLQENNSSLSSQVETLAKAQLELARAKAQVIALELELREERKASITFMEEEEPPAVPFSSASIPSLLPASSEPPCSIGLHECPIEAKEDIIHHPLDDNMLTLHHALIQMERDLGLKDPLDKISEPSQQLDEKLCDISWTSSPALRILSPQLASKVRMCVYIGHGIWVRSVHYVPVGIAHQLYTFILPIVDSGFGVLPVQITGSYIRRHKIRDRIECAILILIFSFPFVYWLP